MRPVLDNFTPFTLAKLKEARHSRELFFLEPEAEKPKRKKTSTPKKKKMTLDKKGMDALEKMPPEMREQMKKMMGL